MVLTGAARSPAASAPPADSVAVRTRIVDALKLDLVGPGEGHGLADEQLPMRERPSNWYVAGFLIPTDAPPDKRSDADEDDDLDAVPETAGLAEESNDERKAARKAFFPSSMGLTFLVPKACRALRVTVRWGDYAPADVEDAAGNRTTVWQRIPRAVPMSIPLAGAADSEPHAVDDSDGLKLNVVERPILAGDLTGELPAGTRSVSCFLVNRRPPDDKQPDRAYAFQAEIEVATDHGFVPRPDLRGARAPDWDEQVADLHFADAPEYATGHGVSAQWTLVDGVCRQLRTAWIGTAEVEKTQTAPVPDVELSMEALGALSRGPDAERALAPLVEQYRAWIAARREAVAAGSLQGTRRETAAQLLNYARIAADRMARGIAMLAADAELLDAFRVAKTGAVRAGAAPAAR